MRKFAAVIFFCILMSVSTYASNLSVIIDGVL